MAATPAQGQLDPAATTLTKLFTATEAAWVRVVVANRDPVGTFFRIQKRLLGAASATKQYVAYDTPIDGNDIYESSVLALANTDEIWVYATDATLSFSLEGIRFP